MYNKLSKINSQKSNSYYMQVLHIDTTTGTLIDEINLAGRSSKPTSVCFGGPNLDTLYITSAQFGLTKDQLASEPDAGALFKVTNIGAKGIGGGVSYKGNLRPWIIELV